MSPLPLPEAIKGLQNLRDGVCILDRIRKRQSSNFQERKVVRRGKSQLSLCRFREGENTTNSAVVSQSKLCGLFVVFVLKGDLRYQLTKMS